MNRLFLFLVLFSAGSLFAAPVRDKNVEVELVSEVASIRPGTPFTVALRMNMDPHWHTYWKNWGDSGLATKIKWNLPDGLEAGPIQWPAPERIEVAGLVSYGYEGTAYLLVDLTPAATLQPGTEARLEAKTSWLMCEEMCIPGKATVSLTLPVRAEAPVPDPANTQAFATARAALPQPADDWTFAFTESQATVTLAATPPAGSGEFKTLSFFPDGRDVIEYGPEQKLSRDGDRYVLEMARSTSATGTLETLHGVLRTDDGQALAVTASPAAEPIEAGTVSVPAASTTAPPPGSHGLAVNLLFAFLGGMILNLMPCVFPVISLKILGFVHQAHDERGKAVAHGLVYAAGVLMSFWVLAAILLAIRGGGDSIGWGFQMQSPGFVIGLIALFFALGLNLVGVFEMGLSLTGAGASLQARSGWSGSFFSGLLATIVATPCTGPLMSVALGYTLTQPPHVSVLIFTFLGLGMAAPYVALTAMPGLARRLPKPGPWMDSMKQFMGLLLLATVVWLLAVLGDLRGVGGVIRALWGLVAVGMGFWILGRWGAISRGLASRVAARALAVLFIAGGIAHAAREPAAESAWEPYSPERLAALQAEGKPVFVDFTATWCLTCQANKFVLHRRPVEKAFDDHGVTRMIADWTDGNETITRALESFGRSGVPLYVLYNGQANAPPVVLPELLTQDIVIEALEKNIGR
jgi:thiol:disulfide interchange protein